MRTSAVGPSPRAWGELAALTELTDAQRTIPTRVGNVFGSSCANRTGYSTPPACSNAIWIASRIDWLTLFGVPFARPPQRVPLGGLGGFAGPGEVGAAS
jgi:hypothetical protein